jgi:GT2 family glycosyltransferase
LIRPCTWATTAGVPPIVSIIIPNWNGRAFLARCLAGTLQSAQESGLEYECIVVDDASTDGSADIVTRDFTAVQLIRQQVNAGFGPTMNRGAREARGSILICLNNDLVPKPALIRELVQPLVHNEHLFGVTGKTIDWQDGRPNHVNMAAHWTNGELKLQHSNSSAAGPTMFLQGGCCSFRRKQFLEFGGFNDLYAPGYWEDYDISYVALKAGLKNLYNPLALAYHFGGGSMSRALGQDRLSSIRLRNAHLFTLLNITDQSMLRSYLNRLPSSVAFSNRPRLIARWNALLACSSKLPEVVAVRLQRNNWQQRSDADIFAEFANHGNPPHE